AGRGDALGTQQLDGLLEVAVGLHQRVAAVEHDRPGAVKQGLDVLGGGCGGAHDWVSSAAGVSVVSAAGVASGSAAAGAGAGAASASAAGAASGATVVAGVTGAAGASAGAAVSAAGVSA